MAEETTPAAPAQTTPAAPAETAAPAAPAATDAAASPASPEAVKAAEATGDAAKSTENAHSEQKPKGAGGTDGGSKSFDPSMIIIFGGFILVFWLLILRPQKKREQQRMEMLKRLKVGDRVLMGSGIIGEIVDMSDDEATLRVDPRKDVRIRVKRSVIVGPAGEASSDQALKEQQPQ